MENKKGSEIFLGVIGVATLIVAIIGATFAYFSADARSGNEAINVKSTTLTIGYEDNVTGLKTSMIPTLVDYALYAGTNEKWIAKESITNETTGVTETGKGECLDSSGNQICSVYEFTVGNPNLTTQLDITGEVFTTINEFANLKFAIYDEGNNQIQAPTEWPKTANQSVPVNIKATLLPSSKDVDESTGLAKEGFDPEKPSTFTTINDMATALKADPNTTTANNKRTYRIVIWIEEANADQTLVDAGKVFAGGVKFSTGSGKGVTGLIAVAKKAESPQQPPQD